MALSNAERQQRFRDKRDEELAELRRESSYRPNKRTADMQLWLRRSENLRHALTLPKDHPWDIKNISEAIMQLIEPTGFAPKIIAALNGAKKKA